MTQKIRYALAADIGGTQMRAALVSSDGGVHARSSCDTEPQRGIEDAGHRLADLLKTALGALGTDDVVGLGVSTAGPLDPSTGVYNNPPNLSGWHAQSIKPTLETDLGIQTSVGHDATLAALAETQLGPHTGAKNLIYVTLSTGIGGGIIANGEMVTGAHGSAGEIGHMTVRPGGLSCGVGCDGCFEGNASGTAIASMARTRIKQGASSAILERAGGDPDAITGQTVLEAAAAGDPVAIETRAVAIENIGIGLGGLINALDPEVLVVGGGVIHGLGGHWDAITQAVRAHVLPVHKDRFILAITTLGDDVGLLGAAQLAFRRTR